MEDGQDFLLLRVILWNAEQMRHVPRSVLMAKSLTSTGRITWKARSVLWSQQTYGHAN